MTNRLAIVATALFVPPVCVGISELALLRLGVDVATVLLVVSGCRSERWWGGQEDKGEEHRPFPGRSPRCRLDRRILGVWGSRCPGKFVCRRRRWQWEAVG